MSQGNCSIPSLHLVETSPQPALGRYLEMFLLDQEARQHTPSTIQTYRYTLDPFLEYLTEKGVTTPKGITPDIIRRFLVRAKQQGLSDNSVHRHARGIKTFLNFLVREELLNDSPMRKVAMPKAEKKILPAFSKEEVGALLAACGKDLLGLRDRAIILCLLDTGLRASEFVAMSVDDVDKDGMVKVMGKGKKERFVRLGAQARKATLRYLSSRKDARPGDPLWIGKRGRLTRSGLYRAMTRLGEQAGVCPIGPHRFRRTFAIWALRGNMDPLQPPGYHGARRPANGQAIPGPGQGRHRRGPQAGQSSGPVPEQEKTVRTWRK